MRRDGYVNLARKDVVVRALDIIELRSCAVAEAPLKKHHWLRRDVQCAVASRLSGDPQCRMG